MDRRQVYGGPRPPFSSLSVVHVHQVHVRVAGEGNPPASSPGVLPPVVSSPASSHSGASAQLRWGKASSSLGECGSGVKVAARAS